MSFDKTVTILAFYTLFLASLALIFLTYSAVDESLKISDDQNDFNFVLFSSIGCGLSCLVFRVVPFKLIYFVHFLMHSTALYLALDSKSKYTRRVRNFHWRGVFDEDPVIFIMMALYTVQYVLSIHMMVFRYGRTVFWRQIITGLHASFGYLTSYGLVILGACRLYLPSMPNKSDASEYASLYRVGSLFLYGVVTWYLLLNPHFEWRRLNRMLFAKTRKKKEKEEEAPSSSSKSGKPRRGRGRVR